MQFSTAFSTTTLVHRIPSKLFVVSLVDMLLTLGMCVVLVGKLRKTEDIFYVSTELQRVGAFALVALCEQM